MNAGQKQLEIEHGRRIAEKAEKIWKRDRLVGRKRLENRLADIKSFSAGLEGASALEIGCGTGLWTRELLSLKCRLTAVDISPDLLKRAKENAGAAALNLLKGTLKTCLSRTALLISRAAFQFSIILSFPEHW